MGAGLSKRRIIQTSVFNELCQLLDPGCAGLAPHEGSVNCHHVCGSSGQWKDYHLYRGQGTTIHICATCLYIMLPCAYKLVDTLI